MANLYDIEFLKSLIGQQETQRLEFKSSRDLLNENSQKRGKFISDKLVPAVSAFLNTDGGHIVIGLEEKDGVGVELSDGVPRSRMSWEQLQSAICDRMQPAVAGYISTFCVHVATNTNSEKLFAFVVDVKPGTTAYQADDKKYYARRSGQNEAMEDKDIRLRMLAGDKPRLAISLQPQIQPVDSKSQHISGVGWDLCIENSGIRTIPRAIIWSSLTLTGLSERSRTIFAWTREYQETTFPIKGVDSTGLFPRQRFELQHFQVSSIAFAGCEDTAAVKMSADVTVYIDDGFPAELRNYDLMADLRPVIENGWKIVGD